MIANDGSLSAYFHAPDAKLYPICLVPSIRTTKNLDGQPEIYFSLIRTLLIVLLYEQRDQLDSRTPSIKTFNFMTRIDTRATFS